MHIYSENSLRHFSERSEVKEDPKTWKPQLDNRDIAHENSPFSKIKEGANALTLSATGMPYIYEGITSGIHKANAVVLDTLAEFCRFAVARQTKP